MKTTLQQIRECSPCSEGWSKLLAHLGKTKADDDELTVREILESNGLDDALWCLQAVSDFDREKRLFAVWCAKQVKHLMTDPRNLNSLEVAKKFAEGESSQEELKAARDAAWGAARDAGWDAARSAAGDAAWAAAGDAAWAAARSAAGDAAWAAGWDAAGDAAWAAAGAAARSAARSAAGDAARAEQKTELLRMLNCIENGVRYEI